MRTVIVRLVEPDDGSRGPVELRGLVHDVASGATQPFTGADGLASRLSALLDAPAADDAEGAASAHEAIVPPGTGGG